VTIVSNPQRRTTGFTLIELIVTIAILTILAGVLVPAVGNYTDKSKKAKVASELKLLANAFSTYQTDCAAWPGNTDIVTVTTTSYAITGMPCMFVNTFTKTGWDGPYLAKGVMVAGAMNVATAAVPPAAGSGLLDPWGNPYYCYTFANGYSGTSGGVVLLSRGKNGALNTTVANIFGNVPASDDILQVVTYKP
jgi:general secretion pathway protein G